MREVSVRMLHLLTDLARAGGLDPGALIQGLPSIAAQDGKTAGFVDWDDFTEALERLERMLGGPEGVGRAMRAALPTAYPEIRAFAAVFFRPIPLFAFVMTRLNRTMYRHLEIEVERVGEERVRWRQSIPEPYRACEAFHRLTAPLVEIFPCHLDLPEARVELADITPRSADFVVVFPPSSSLGARGAHAVSAASAVLAAQIEDAFMRIAESMRSHDGRDPALDRPAPSEGDWPSKLALSPRQRDVFALLVEGRPNKEIARALTCSERNVEFHVGRILRAARVTSRSELLVKVLGARP